MREYVDIRIEGVLLMGGVIFFFFSFDCSCLGLGFFRGYFCG